MIMAADGKQVYPCSLSLGVGCCYRTQFNTMMRQWPVSSSQDNAQTAQRGEINLIMTSSVPTNHTLTHTDLDSALWQIILCPVYHGGMFIVG